MKAAMIRVPSALLAQLDSLIPRIEKDVATATVLGNVTRSSVARLALVRGLEVLEQQYHQSSVRPGPFGKSRSG